MVLNRVQLAFLLALLGNVVSSLDAVSAQCMAEIDALSGVIDMDIDDAAEQRQRSTTARLPMFEIVVDITRRCPPNPLNLVPKNERTPSRSFQFSAKSAAAPYSLNEKVPILKIT